MANPVLANRLAQVGFIVRDVEATKIKFAEFFGVPVPPTCDGIHHIAFPVKNTDEKIKAAEKFGAVCVQRGKYGGGNGEYAYLDFTKDLKCLMETLESY